MQGNFNNRFLPDHCHARLFIRYAESLLYKYTVVFLCISIIKNNKRDIINIKIFRYLREFTILGTAGGMYHFRDQIRAGNPAAFFVMNGDVCADFPLKQLYDFHKDKGPDALVNIILQFD